MQTITPVSRQEWREWLSQYAHKEQKVTLIYYKKCADVNYISWKEAVEEALCFGWIDSTKKSIDEFRYQQIFTPRNSKSGWSQVNKNLVEQLEKQGFITEQGYASIRIAKENGTWTKFDDCYQHILPSDLDSMLSKENLYDLFFKQSDSKKTLILKQLLSKKQTSTRQRFLEDLKNSLHAKNI